jgi:hypothetical protein
MKPLAGLSALGLALGLAIGQPAAAATLDLTFDYRITPTDGPTATIATAHFQDIIDANGLPGIDLRLTNVGSNLVPGVGATSYISGLLLAFDYDEAELPGILVEQFTDDTAHSDRWEPQEDVATVDGFTFTSELGFPRTENASTAGWRLGVGDNAHVWFVNAGGYGDTPLPHDLTVATLIEALRGGSAPAGAPDLFAVVKIRSIPNVTGGEDIESVPTVVIGGVQAAPVPVPAALPLFLSAFAGLGLFRKRRA